MRIQDMFERDIDRNINGVIKIEQNDEEVIEQELAEYVVTNELRGHFSTFFDAYERALDAPTDKIGVWISASSAPVNRTSSRCSRTCSRGRRQTDGRPSTSSRRASRTP